MTSIKVLSVIAAISLTVGVGYVLFSAGLPPRPSANAPLELPWTEGVKTEQIDGKVEEVNTDSIYYVKPTGVWHKGECVTVKILIPGPSGGELIAGPSELVEEQISTADREDSESFENYFQISNGVTTLDRCICGYRVEWECTEKSRYVTASATIGGKTYVRYIYESRTWHEDKTISKRVNDGGIDCQLEEVCDFYCPTRTPPSSEWGMQCKENTPRGTFSPDSQLF